MNRLSHILPQLQLPSDLEFLWSILSATLTTLYYDRIAVSGNKSSTQIDIALLLRGQNMSWGIPDWASCGHYFTISPSYPSRNQISIDLKSAQTWRYGYIGTSYDEYIRKLSIFAKIFYLKKFVDWKSVWLVFGNLNFPEYSDSPESSLSSYAKITFDYFINKLNSYR